MENTSSQNSPTHYRTLRIWLPILLLPLMVFARFVPDLIQDGPSYTWVASAFGPFLISLVLFGWWLFASLARWTERVVGLLGIIGILGLGVSILRSVHAWSTIYCDDHSDGYGCFYVRACSFFSAFVLSADPDCTLIVIRRSWIFRFVKDRRCLGEFCIRPRLALEQFS